MKAIYGLAVAVVLFIGAPAHAQVVNLSKMTCKEFLASSKDTMTVVWAYLYGYYADDDDEAEVDIAEVTSVGQQLADACKTQPDTDVLSVADPLYSK
jgi:hypothetical protein